MTALLPWWWRWAALAALGAAVAIFTGVKVHAHDRIALDALQGRFDAFRTQVAYAGKLAQIAADKEIAAGKLAKENADRENKATHAADAVIIAKLRADAAKRNSSGGSLRPNPPGSVCPEGQVCFDRTGYQRAIGEFDTAARQLADQCTAVSTDLNTAREWAKKGP